MEKLVKKIGPMLEGLRGGKPRALVAIDGRCASGKTTLAGGLQERYGCGVVHMDHFFLREEQRTRERLEEPGGNIDHERFLEEVLLPLGRGGAFSYRPYDCRLGRLSEPVFVPEAPLVVVEGSYSCHPALWGYYDLRLFLTVAPKEQLRRILLRDGPEKAEAFKRTWIPLEEGYFSAFDIEGRCDGRFAT